MNTQKQTYYDMRIVLFLKQVLTRIVQYTT